jgi:hypothetical protein
MVPSERFGRGWAWSKPSAASKETVANEHANKDDKPFRLDEARQRLIDEVDRIRARNQQKDD